MFLAASTSGASSSPIHVFSDHAAICSAAAEQIVSQLQRVLAAQDRFTLALAGGNTPRPVYEHLAYTHRNAIPWDRLHLFWGDERFVSHDDPSSNVRMVRESLLNDVPIPPGNVHPMPTTDDDSDSAAAAYADTLHAAFSDDTTFDLVLLGLGDDGHTASLFPDDPQATITDDRVPWVRAVTAPPRYDVRTRLTLTLPAINRARDVFFLVSGAAKHDAVESVLTNQDASLPPTHVHPRGQCRWLLDEAARFGSDTETGKL